MDTEGNIHEGSEIKLKLYELYLEEYLRVLTTSPFFQNINIYDAFCGTGITKNDKEGSALRAFNVINKIDKKGKNIQLYLNDIDTQTIEKLKKNINIQENSFVNISIKPADDFINQSIEVNYKSFFFIDPFGYTQVKQSTLDNLFQHKNIEILIFIPIYNIYRFLRKEESREQDKPIASFLNDMGIGENEAIKAKSVEEFAKLIVSSFKTRAKTQFTYHQVIENKKFNNKYALFFITHNSKGAEKFLEVQKKMNEEMTKQLPLYFVREKEEAEIKEALLNFIKQNNPSNTDIYLAGIINSFLPKELNPLLKNLETSNFIKVEEIGEFKRRKGYFYLTPKDKKIIVRANNDK